MFPLNFKNPLVLILGGLGCFILGIVAFFIFQGSEQVVSEEENWYIAGEEVVSSSEVDSPPRSPLTFIVDIKGEVNQPGIYEMEEGERVFDAIQTAGGLTNDANEKALNLAEKCYDEMVIYVPSLLEGEDISIPTVGQGKGKIRINVADQQELSTLPGIGPAKAGAIINYIQENGPFQSAEEIVNVPGIGDKTLENMREAIVVP